jgi:hypothetical protein
MFARGHIACSGASHEEDRLVSDPRRIGLDLGLRRYEHVASEHGRLGGLGVELPTATARRITFAHASVLALNDAKRAYG